MHLEALPTNDCGLVIGALAAVQHQSECYSYYVAFSKFHYNSSGTYSESWFMNFAIFPMRHLAM